MNQDSNFNSGVYIHVAILYVFTLYAGLQMFYTMGLDEASVSFDL